MALFSGVIIRGSNSLRFYATFDFFFWFPIDLRAAALMDFICRLS